MPSLVSLFAASAIAVASATIIAPAKVQVEIRGTAVQVRESGAKAPDHRVIVTRDAQARTCSVTWVGY